MSLKNQDLSFGSNPCRLKVYKGDLSRLSFDLACDFMTQTGTPLSLGSAKIQQKEGSVSPAFLGIQDGQAFLDKPGDLPYQGLIHMVMPSLFVDDEEMRDFVSACHWNSLVVAYDYLKNHDLEKLTLAYDVLDDLDKETCEKIVRLIAKMRRLYPETKMIEISFVCTDQTSYTNLKEVISNEKYS